MKSKRILAGLLATIMCATTAFSGVTAFASDPGVDSTDPDVTVSAEAETEPSAFQQELESKYIDPDRVYGTEVRWWLGEASHTVETLMDEIQAMYDGGFRGVELCMQSDGDNATNPIYAYGSEEWSYKWKLLMNKCLDLGMGVSLTSGTHWATANLPYNPETGEGLDPDSQAASQVISMGTSTVDAGASPEALPVPSTRRAVARFLGAYAYRVTDNTNYIDTTAPAIDLTAFVTQGNDVWTQNLSWTAPDDGTYRIFAYWSQGAAQSASPAQYTAYAINYFDSRGIDALKEFWEANYLDDPELNEKILEGDVQLFMDSIELNATGGITYWTEDLPEEFMARKGYDIMPYMFLLNGTGMSLVLQSLGTYRLDGEEILNRQIQNDFLEVLTDLQMERKFAPLREWLNSYGIKTRYQPSYGRTFEISEPIMYVDYVETESLNGYNQIDFYRVHAGGAKLQNKAFSNELSAVPRFSFSNQYHLRDAYSFYAAGGQRAIWHIWGADFNRPAATANNWLTNDGAMSTFFRFGKRNPGARDYDEFNAHLGRVQQLMQTGKARSDVGFIHNNWHANTSYGAGIGFGSNSQLTHVGRTYRSTELQNNGYTYDYFSPEFLFADDVYFDEETKTIEGAGYKALVLYQPYLDVKGAERILEWAKKGLKVVILDDAATYSMFSTRTDEELAEIISELKTLDTVRQATTTDYVPLITIGTTASPADGGYDNNVLEMLQELDVYPYAEYVEENYQLLTQTRTDDDGNLYLYAYNYCPNDCHHNSRDTRIQDLDHGTNVKTEIKMDGLFVPYAIDAWSGEVTQLANYRYEDDKTVFPIDLDYDNVALFAFEAIEEDDVKLHIVSTDAESAYTVGNNLIVRATKTDLYNAVLSNGGSYASVIEVPEAYDITDWNLTVESWNAGTEALYRSEPRLDGGGTTTDQRWATEVTEVDAQFETMTTWNNIPEVGRDHSGYGRYEATFNWDANAASGAYLDFGDTFVGSMKVWINGTKVGGDISANPTKTKRSVGVEIDGAVPEGQEQYTGGVSWTKPVADISAYLVDGENEIVIAYSSDLTNRMRQRGILTATQISTIGGAWWNYFSDYRDYGPSQAKIIPFVEETIIDQGGDGLRLSTDAYDVQAGDYANITTEFVETVNSNTAIINYYYDTELFEQRNFHPAGGVQVISRETTDYGAKITVMVQSYNTQTYGMLALQAKPDAQLVTGWATVKAMVEYVVLDENGEKEIKTSAAATSFRVRGEPGPIPIPEVPGDTNFDGIVDLIDLSNMIDWFGIDSSDSRWNVWYAFFDFNNNGSIDIYDISQVAQWIEQ